MDATTALKVELPTISPASLITPSDYSASLEMSPTPSSIDDSSASPPPDAHSPSDSSDANLKKKRKSWGQVLPEPTTNLPPRKRAKTDAEKAQRKYERVQRNRQAAHNSRLRKQNEMDRLAEENVELREQVARLVAEVAQLKGGKTIPNLKFEPSDHDSTYDSDHNPSPASPSFNDFTLNIAQSADTHSAEMC